MELVPRSVLLGKRKRPIVGRALVNGAVEAAASGTKGIGGRGTAGAGADTDAVANHRDDRPRRDGAGRAKDCSFRAVNVVVSASRSDATAAEAQHDPADSDARYLACLVRMELAARSRSSNTASGRVKYHLLEDVLAALNARHPALRHGTTDRETIAALRAHEAGVEVRLSTAERVGAGGGVGGMGNGGAGGAGGGYEARWAAGEGEEAVPHAIRLGRGVLLEDIPPAVASPLDLLRTLRALPLATRLPSADADSSLDALDGLTPFLPAELLPPPSPGGGAQHRAPRPSHRLPTGSMIVYLRTEADVEALSTLLPWSRMDEDSATAEVDEVDEAGVLLRRLRRRGVRALSLIECIRLKQEYIAYKTRTEELLAVQRRTVTARTDAVGSARKQERATQPLLAKKEPDTDNPRASPAYPPGRLLFATRLPDNTNKTALKALLNGALGGDGGTVDYVDWDKGRVHAYIRVATRAAATALCAAFPVDTSGEAGDGDMKRTRIELVKGQREEAYWLALPDKIRLAAVGAMSEQ